MDPPRLNAQACLACVHACTDGVLSKVASAGPETLAAIPDVAKIHQFAEDVVGLCELQLAGPVVASMPFVHPPGCEAHPAAVRAHVENVVLKQSIEFLHQPAVPESRRVLEFIWNECRFCLAEQAQAEERDRRQQQQQQPPAEHNKKRGEDRRFGTFKRKWRSVELRYLAELFNDNPDLEFAAAARAINAHYAGQTVDGVPFTERTADAVRYQVAKRGVLENARAIREKKLRDEGGEASGEAEAAIPTLRPA